ncbi:MOSC domain-containing protein [Uruburuella testudinis]|uniref:MOSC domain-containing protein n=1 Tax=Uruburuella testudinis TaxID=1282863 RepID=A0ABY4DX30_9NEIS|nr:MOSC domain-containing protein [Uruburuella testudinis]UOO82629.1 MOSC domain-containing protein [Uruburuella testudinis]
MQLTEIVYYPVKSMRGINAQSALIRPEGMPHDREWLIATPEGMFLTARKLPQMLLWQATPHNDGLTLTAPDGSSRSVHTGDFTQNAEVAVWKDRFNACHGSPDTDTWLSQQLGTACRLYYLGRQSRRLLSFSQTLLSFADGAPYLLTSTASLNELNSQLETPVEMRRFRPNLVIDGNNPYEEDRWQRIRIGEVEFELFKPCTRCVMTTIDLDNGRKHPHQEPLATLAVTRNACFGMNMIARNSGTVYLNDEITLL